MKSTSRKSAETKDTVEDQYYDTLDSLPWGNSAPNQATVSLAAGERAIDPTRHGQYVYGPTTVEYTRHDDGGITVKLIPS